MKKLFGTAALLTLSLGAVAQEDFHREYAGAIAKAQNAEAWYAADMVEADMVVNFGGKERLAGTATFDPALGISRFDLRDGGALIFDGEECYVTPASLEYGKARFDVITWPYFLAAPMKLMDDGTHIESKGTMDLEGKPHEAARLTFGENVGDAPDDWYVLYRDNETDRLKAMAYIVTYFSGKETGKEEPHVVVYNEYEQFAGVTLPTEWSFYNWNEKEGAHGEEIGHVSVSDVRFTTYDPKDFEIPEDSRLEAK